MSQTCCALVSLIMLRTLRKDCTRYTQVCCAGPAGAALVPPCILVHTHAPRQLVVAKACVLIWNRWPKRADADTLVLLLPNAQKDHDDLESLERDMNEESGWKLVSSCGLAASHALF